MHLLHLALQATAWLVAIAWLFKFIEAARGLPTIPNLLASEYDRSPAGAPYVTVIVPARNEAASIGACLESLLGQDYPHLQILAVDDRSTDETGAIIDSLARVHPARLTAIHVEGLPANWLGKTHAMALAARLATRELQSASGEFQTARSEYLLFTDADIVFQPTILRRSLAHAVATNADHLVTMPTTLAKSSGEAMLLSFMQVMGILAVRLWRVSDPNARDNIGVGAFNFIRTSAYVQLGGFDAIPMEIVEDMALAHRIKRAGFHQRVAHAPGAVAVHWAVGISGILNGLTKNIFAVFRFRALLLLVAAAGLALFCLAPIAFLAIRAPHTGIPALLALAAIAGLYTLSSRTSRISPWFAAFFPVSAALVVYSMLRSMVVTLRDGGVTWRGTFYALADLRKQTNRPRIKNG